MRGDDVSLFDAHALGGVTEGPVRYPQEFSRVMERARVRCVDLGNSERVMGYMDSYRVYSDLADEFRGLPSWLFQEITRMNSAGRGSSAGGFWPASSGGC
jgi:hypothetical protein